MSWQAYVPWRAAFEPVLDQRFYTMDYLDGEVASGRARCWSNENAAIVATIREYPTGAKEVHGLIAAGTLAEIGRLIPRAEQWGADQGAIVASIESREGWAKTLAKDGYEPYQTTVRKELTLG